MDNQVLTPFLACVIRIDERDLFIFPHSERHCRFFITVATVLIVAPLPLSPTEVSTREHSPVLRRHGERAKFNS
jgi:hypothetical protein